MYHPDLIIFSLSVNVFLMENNPIYIVENGFPFQLPNKPDARFKLHYCKMKNF